MKQKNKTVHPKLLKSYRLAHSYINYLIFVVFLLTEVGFSLNNLLYSIPIYAIIAFLFWLTFLPMIIPCYIFLYTNRLKIGNKTILFDDIWIINIQH